MNTAMKNLSILLLLASVLSVTSGLKCYQCSGCEEGQRGHPVECSTVQNSCRKVVLGSRIEKACSLSATCKFADVEKGLYDVFADLSSSITGGDKGADASNTMIHCCETDYCNSQTTVTASLLLLLPTFVLTALLQ